MLVGDSVAAPPVALKRHVVASHVDPHQDQVLAAGCALVRQPLHDAGRRVRHVLPEPELGTHALVDGAEIAPRLEVPDHEEVVVAGGEVGRRRDVDGRAPRPVDRPCVRRGAGDHGRREVERGPENVLVVGERDGRLEAGVGGEAEQGGVREHAVAEPRRRAG